MRKNYDVRRSTDRSRNRNRSFHRGRKQGSASQQSITEASYTTTSVIDANRQAYKPDTQHFIVAPKIKSRIAFSNVDAIKYIPNREYLRELASEYEDDLDVRGHGPTYRRRWNICQETYFREEYPERECLPPNENRSPLSDRFLAHHNSESEDEGLPFVTIEQPVSSLENTSVLGGDNCVQAQRDFPPLGIVFYNDPRPSWDFPQYTIPSQDKMGESRVYEHTFDPSTAWERNEQRDLRRKQVSCQDRGLEPTQTSISPDEYIPELENWFRVPGYRIMQLLRERRNNNMDTTSNAATCAYSSFKDWDDVSQADYTEAGATCDETESEDSVFHESEYSNEPQSVVGRLNFSDSEEDQTHDYYSGDSLPETTKACRQESQFVVYTDSPPETSDASQQDYRFANDSPPETAGASRRKSGFVVFTDSPPETSGPRQRAVNVESENIENIRPSVCPSVTDSESVQSRGTFLIQTGSPKSNAREQPMQTNYTVSPCQAIGRSRLNPSMGIYTDYGNAERSSRQMHLVNAESVTNTENIRPSGYSSGTGSESLNSTATFLIRAASPKQLLEAQTCSGPAAARLTSPRLHAEAELQRTPQFSNRQSCNITLEKITQLLHVVENHDAAERLDMLNRMKEDQLRRRLLLKNCLLSLVEDDSRQ